MTSDAQKYDLKVGDTFEDQRKGKTETFKITDITPDGGGFQLRWANMSDDDICPYVTAERLFEIAHIDKEARRQFTKEEMLLAFAAGFKSSAEGHNGECNDFTDAPFYSTRDLLAIESADQQLRRDFDHFLQKDISEGQRDTALKPQTKAAITKDDLEIGRWYWITYTDEAAEPELAQLNTSGWAVILHDFEVQSEVTVHAGPIEPYTAPINVKV